MGPEVLKVERASEIGEAVEAALKCDKPAVIDIADRSKSAVQFSSRLF